MPRAPDPFARPVLDLARALVGATLLVDGVGGVIVETEAYARHDAASHSCRGPTARNRAMFGPPGRAYVYRSYGIHWCFNVVGGEEPGCAVLIRALEPTHGLDRMQARRGLDATRLLCSGPGRLTQALGLDASHDGADLGAAPFSLAFGPASPGLDPSVGPSMSSSLDGATGGATGGAGNPALAVGPRIGISRNAEAPWRFGLAASRCLSRPFPRAPRSPPLPEPPEPPVAPASA